VASGVCLYEAHRQRMAAGRKKAKPA